VSKLTGKPIKACRDEKWLAVIPIGVAGVDKMLFQFRVTPGSFKNFKGYSEKFRGREIDMKDVTTRLTFDPDANGVVSFNTTEFVPLATAQVRELAYEKNSTDVFVGRSDAPASPPVAIVGTYVPPALILSPPGATVIEPAIVTNTPRAGESAEQTEARKTRGRPKKAPAETTASVTAPFLKDAPSAPFGIQTDAPSPPNEIAEGIKSFFD
jgi:hypothetical protein